MAGREEKKREEALKMALKKIESSEIAFPKCLICNHPGCDKMTEVYLDNGKDVEKTIEWFEEKFKRNFGARTYRKHFREHIDPIFTKTLLIRKMKMDELKRKTIAAQEENVNRIGSIKQIMWDFIEDVYINKKSELATKESKNDHRQMSRQFVELAKIYKEYYQMELEFLGMGKTKEEQRQAMENFVAGMINQAIDSLEDIPEAQKRLSAFLNIIPSKENPNEIIEDNEDEI